MRKMKDSGIEWIGEIPQEWDVRRIKFTLDAHSSGAWGTNEGEDEADIICVRVADFDYSQLTVDFHDKMTVRSYSAKTITESSIRSGDILLEKSGGGETTPVGRSVLFESNEPMMCANFIEWLRPNRSFDSRFLTYWLSAAYTNGFSKRNIKQTTGIQNLDVPAFLSEKIASPDVANQVSIADYLDQKCAEIDAIIAAKEKTNELLKERRQSIIYEAVTKGLDPTVPMKDSGIEWIGEIPEGWATIRVKHLATEKDSLFLDGDWINSDVITDEGIRYLTSGNVGEGFYKEQGKGYISEETFKKLNCLAAFPGDLMISRLNEPVGRCCIIPNDEDYYVVAVDNVILRPNQNFCKKYLLYCMNTNGYANTALMAASGTTMQRISRTALGNLTIPVATYSEQIAIADYLDERCSEIDAIISANNISIEKLKEYRQSVIYER